MPCARAVAETSRGPAKRDSTIRTRSAALHRRQLPNSTISSRDAVDILKVVHKVREQSDSHRDRRPSAEDYGTDATSAGLRVTKRESSVDAAHDEPKPAADGVWIVDSGPIGRVIRMPIRMTVLRLASGALWLHSPTPFTPALRDALESLGPIGHIVAPNSAHWMFIEAWQDACPDAVVWAAPGLQARRAVRRSRVRFDHTLNGVGPADWEGEIDQIIVPGGAGFREAAFLHRASRTLVLTDLIVNLEAQTLTPLTRAFAWATHMLAPNGSTPNYLRLVLRLRRAAATAALARVIAWAPERVIFAHGAWFDRDGAARLRQALCWLVKT
jgi:hypothetical protein